MPKRVKKESALELEDELQHVLYVVSHDLGKYIRHMREFTSILLEESKEKFNEEEIEYANMLMRASSLSQDFIVSLLQYSRVQTHGEEFKELDGNKLLDEAKQNLQELIQQTNTSISYSSLPTIKGDKKQLLYVWEQLLKNAMTFIEDRKPPKIIIGSKEDKGNYVFSIQDNGIGIEEKNHDKIFKLFRTLHPEGKYPGNGAGLAIAKRIIKRHGGNLWVDSTPGKGSTFYVSVPKN